MDAFSIRTDGPADAVSPSSLATSVRPAAAATGQHHIIVDFLAEFFLPAKELMHLLILLHATATCHSLPSLC